MKQFWPCQPRASKSASTSLTPAWIFSAVMPGGSAGSAKSTVAGSRPTNTTRFIDPPPTTTLTVPQNAVLGSGQPLLRVHVPPWDASPIADALARSEESAQASRFLLETLKNDLGTLMAEGRTEAAEFSPMSAELQRELRDLCDDREFPRHMALRDRLIAVTLDPVAHDGVQRIIHHNDRGASVTRRI